MYVSYLYVCVISMYKIILRTCLIIQLVVCQSLFSRQLLSGTDPRSSTCQPPPLVIASQIHYTLYGRVVGTGQQHLLH